MNKDLTKAQNDYAIFLPAISSFYSTYIGKQQHGEYVPKSRMPTGIPEMENMNFFNKKKGHFTYKWGLYSAGHAKLDMDKDEPGESMLRNRSSDTFLIADSGGFQIGKGVWKGKWNDPSDADAEKRRALVLKWLCKISDYSMVLDIPSWSYQNPEVAEAIGIHSFEDAVSATKYNNEYFIKNRTGDTKFLNVLQGGNHHEADLWYDEMKDYCDPTKHDNHFNGWGMGGQNMCDIHLVLKRLVTLIYDGLLVEGIHDWMHFLGTSKLEWATLLTDIQRSVRKYHNPNFTISFDCASPFLATANGQIYHNTETKDRTKWVYRMSPTADDKKYASDTRKFSDGCIADGIHKTFQNSPISEQLLIKDICVYAPGDLNKIGKEGKTSWDSFSYALMMGHNVWFHINAVQEANRQYDAGNTPNMLINDTFTAVRFKDLVNDIFSAGSKQASMDIIENNSRYWQSIIGTRGFTGKRNVNASAQFNNLFEMA